MVRLREKMAAAHTTIASQNCKTKIQVARAPKLVHNGERLIWERSRVAMQRCRRVAMQRCRQNNKPEHVQHNMLNTYS